MSSFRTAAQTARRLYQRMFRRQASERIRDVITTLAQVPAFATCTTSTLRAVAESMHRRTYRRDEYIYYEGDPGLGLYVIRQGRVRLLAEASDDGRAELGQLGPHGLFGTLSIFGDFRRLETVQAMTEASVVGFFQPDLKNLTKRNPKAGAEITMLLARHLAEEHVDLVDAMAHEVGRSSALSTVADTAARALEDERRARGA
ncbi:MAG: cyclic nucleotide-binding domain-containing protein [Bacteroidetes bacterium]|jgi:CRP-like cAMP-binding protein|nr:cyclic nucleotide-binding domain-containing protein [Bacteroidota bacterium]